MRNPLMNQRLLVICITLLVVLVGCSKDSAEKEPLVTVQTAVAQKTDLSQVVNAEAVLYPKNQSAITPKISSPVRKFLVNRGSRVHRGQLLAVLENRDVQAAVTENQGSLEQAQAAYTTTTAAGLPEELKKAELDAKTARESLDAAQKLFDSRQELFKEGALPRKDLDQASVALVQARAQSQIAEQHLAALESVGRAQQTKSARGQLTAARGKFDAASAQLSYTDIRSPIDGVVTDRPVYPGETPPQGVPILTIMDTSSVIAKAHIPQDQAALLKVGDAATISSNGTLETPAKVTLVSPATDPNSTTVEIWVEAPNPKGAFRPGATVHLEITAARVSNAVAVPSGALVKNDEGAWSVMVVGSDGRAHQTPVEVGIRSGDLVQITKGLSGGETVIASGAYGLPDNTRVEAAKAAPANEGKPAAAEKE